MSLLITFLTFILVVNCLFLMLLVLVQLPKKEAGAGLAFGAGAVDTLIGAGSGNALTKMTKYSAGTFMGLALLLSILNSRRSESSSQGLEQALSKKASATPMFTAPPVTPPTTGTLAQPMVQPAQPAETQAMQTASNLLQIPPVTTTPAPAAQPAAVDTNAPLSLPTPPAQNQPQ